MFFLHVKERKGDGRVILRCILNKWVLRMAAKCTYCRTVAEA